MIANSAQTFMKHTFVVLLIASSASAADVQIADIDLERLYIKSPPRWYISQVQKVTAPDGWKKSEGGNGVRIVISREPYSYELKNQGDGTLAVSRPEFVLCIMPQDFVAKSA